ncbi:peptidoglycan DD-metalloendopeptidase family protein [Formosa algae]|uniref:Murein DD-endopeptidase MepM/ murein hydrolase activator NlpD n=1 Tax=Formosa algae TaxID=225843 RepID=A0A9X0YJ29_9FLAO|nr:peptidoglycan DD-metalloendopeptidase family protein [Formosa algae]MBP1839470.1 murein DD-endopeptidase MepM/ murein hydrolase activator NlpD [Formosa algae]MDQ0334774.1 murein DD-endopeptidase MepM/ murein hydrolase activator NlpD [Formosa algae]OEI82023.1 peptidase M23 [Formosa algae]
MSNRIFISLLKSIDKQFIKVLAPEIALNDYVSIDLSTSNESLQYVNVSSSQDLNQYINLYMAEHGAHIAYGGYMEVRDIYKRSTYFNTAVNTSIRNIHIGMDLWCKAGTPVLAALDGEVHGFKNNMNYGDYGPTIILKHTISDVVFYTLYGHLSSESIATLEVGQQVKQGHKIAELGTSDVNGDYPPHLHFQIIHDIQEYFGDYPGVCSETDLEFYTANCPDPNLLLKMY